MNQHEKMKIIDFFKDNFKMSCEIDTNINYLISKIRELENENKSLKHEVAELLDERKSLENEVAGLVDENGSLKQEITELKTENAYLDTNYLTAMNRIDELEVMLESHFD